MIYNGDSIEIMKTLDKEQVDLAFADPPYFLSNDGLSIHSGKVVSVNKGEWDKKKNYENVRRFTETWIKEVYDLLKPGGSLWVSGTQHNIFDIRLAMLKIGFKIQNIVIWHKVDPPPLIYKTRFQYSYEFLIWGSKGKCKTFNYEAMFKVNEQEMHDVWDIYAVRISEKKFGYHPTQKPEKLLERIILATSKEGDLVLDPFLGSGTTCYVAKKLNRRYIGIEKETNFFKIAEARIASIKGIDGMPLEKETSSLNQLAG